MFGVFGVWQHSQGGGEAKKKERCKTKKHRGPYRCFPERWTEHWTGRFRFRRSADRLVL